MSDEVPDLTVQDDAAQETNSPARHPAPRSVVSRLRKFASAHDGATAVLQDMGNEGVRITLVGGDGILGDQIVGTPALANAAADAAGIATSEWDRTLVSKADTARGHHERMAGYRALRR